MRKIGSLFLLLAVAWAAVADVSPQQAYIDKYAKWAVQEMYRSGIPASITLAQGMLESRNGLSELATKGNNHFGIKCHDWKGKSMKVDDDRKGECFRVYGSAYDSFKDHSDFLRYRDRYKFLFDFDVTDYKSWAHGLSKAGYATDPQYPAKLIKLIEDYGLSRFDTDGEAVTPAAADSAPVASPAQTPAPAQKPKAKSRQRLPESPTVLEESVALDRKATENFHFS
ncbi:MAG: glucosaminidase domain-containing protein, partial [Bacteroidales bacterium]|nr:glucosaminidase domain-containing protein [Bacteroidales bacterium]